MSLNNTHPEYGRFAEYAVQNRDTYEGERAVKGKRDTYLKPTAGMLSDGWPHGAGGTQYDACIGRATVPDLHKDAVQGLLGVLHRKPVQVELPPQMEALIERASSRNETMQQFFERITEEQLIVGRIGLLADVMDSEGGEETQPYLVLNAGERLTNWDEGTRVETGRDNLNLVVINERGPERDESLNWQDKTQWRVLKLGDLEDNEGSATGKRYQVATVEDSNDIPAEGDFTAPTISGREAEEIPFVFCNTRDIASSPDVPPLNGLSNQTLLIYRGEADYRQSLFMQGQDTLVISGTFASKSESTEQQLRVGANARLHLTQGSSAAYVGVSSTGLPEMRTALENDYARGVDMAGRLLESTSRERESGEALRIRVAARTASLVQVVTTSAFALQELLRKLARWGGWDDKAVVVTPNLDFVGLELSGADVLGWTTAKQEGAPVSNRTIHGLMTKAGATAMSYDEELEEMSTEETFGGTPPPGIELPPDPDAE